MILGIILCFLPLIAAILIFTLGYKVKFSHQLLACLFGLIAVLPISFIQFFLPEISIPNVSPIVNALLKSLLLYGLVEELIKMIACIPLPHKNYTDNNYLMLAFVMGLSLGCFESVVYFLDHLQIATSKGAQLMYGPVALRIFTSDVIHMMCTGLCGLFIWTCHEKKPKVSFVITAVVLHGIYDFFAGFSSNLKLFSLVVVLMAIAECRIKYTSLKKDDK